MYNFLNDIQSYRSLRLYVRLKEIVLTFEPQRISLLVGERQRRDPENISWKPPSRARGKTRVPKSHPLFLYRPHSVLTWASLLPISSVKSQVASNNSYRPFSGSTQPLGFKSTANNLETLSFNSTGTVILCMFNSWYLLQPSKLEKQKPTHRVIIKSGSIHASIND